MRAGELVKPGPGLIGDVPPGLGGGGVIGLDERLPDRGRHNRVLAKLQPHPFHALTIIAISLAVVSQNGTERRRWTTPG
jgi:hypothetical protein